MKITRTRTFRATVTVTVPDGDLQTSSTFTAVFKALSTEDLAEHRLGTIEEQDAYLQAFLVGWEGLIDDLDGTEKPFEFSEANRRLLISDVFVRRALLEAYSGAMVGAKRGN